MQKEVTLSHTDNLLCQHFEYIAEHLEKAPLTYTHWAKTALKKCTYLALHVDEGYGKHGIQGDDDQCYKNALG